MTLFEWDGVTPLLDTDGDTTPDTGTLAVNASTTIVVDVTVGWTGLSDTVMVTASSSFDLQVFSTATDSTTVPPTIILTLSDTTLALGSPDPTCEGLANGSRTGEFTVYNGSSGNEGCAYVWDAFTATIRSNKPWTGTIAGTDVAPTSGITLASGNFHYDAVAAATSYSDCSSDTALTATPTSFESAGTTGTSLYDFHHCVLVDWDDDDGTIDSKVIYTVQQ